MCILKLCWGLPRWLRGKRICLPMQETRVQALSCEDSLEKEMAIHSSILAWEIPWTEEPGGLQSIVSQRVKHNLATEQKPHTHTIYRCTKIVSIFRGSDQRGPRTLGNLNRHDVVRVLRVKKRREKRPRVMLQSWWGSQATSLQGSLTTLASPAFEEAPHWALRLTAIFLSGFLQYKDLLRILISTFVETEDT